MCTNIAADSDSAYTCLPPASGKKQLTDIERLLATHQSDAGVLPLPSMLDSFAGQAVNQMEDALMIFISKNAAQNQAAIEAFTGREQAVWVVPCPRNEPCCLQTADNIRLINREVNDF